MERKQYLMEDPTGKEEEKPMDIGRMCEERLRKPENRLMRDTGSEEDEEATVFGSSYARSSIHSITFLGTLDSIPETAWDVSEDGNGSVMAWVAGTQDLFIAANGEIKAGDSCEGMFARYENLKKIEFNGLFNTSQVADMCGMFEGCTALEELDISGFDTSQVTDMSWIFAGCAALEELDISGFDTAQVLNMRGMFSGCAALKELDISGFDTSQVKGMSFMFSGCAALEELDISGFDTSQVTGMVAMFKGCAALKGLDLSSFNTSQVKTMHWMFKDCALLEELDISGFDTSQTADMKGMFSGCAALEELDLSGFDTLQVTRAQEMFHGCNTLQKLYVSERGFDDSQMKSMFKGCSRRPKIERKAGF